MGTGALAILLAAPILGGEHAAAQETLACWLPSSGVYFALNSKLVEHDAHRAQAFARAGLGFVVMGAACSVLLPDGDGVTRYEGELRLVPTGERVIEPSRVLRRFDR
jgi:hypothetical protein